MLQRIPGTFHSYHFAGFCVCMWEITRFRSWRWVLRADKVAAFKRCSQSCKPTISIVPDISSLEKLYGLARKKCGIEVWLVPHRMFSRRLEGLKKCSSGVFGSPRKDALYF